MTRLRRPTQRIIATYGDSWSESIYRTFAGVIAGIPARSPAVLADFGPVPLVPETSAEAPPWRGRAAGALVTAATTGDVEAFTAWLRRGDVPTVMMVSALIDSGIPTVCVDYRELGRIAARHLATDCGCTSFLHVGERESMATSRREEGFRDALAADGRDLHTCRIDYFDITEERVPKRFDDPQLDSLLLTLPRPIGVFATADKHAAVAAACCSRLGLRMPQDVAVLGVNNTMLAHVHFPSLSSIRIREREVGEAAMRLLTDLMAGGSPPRHPVLVGGCELYARASTVGPRELGTVLTVDVAMERIHAAACSGLTVEKMAETLGVSRRTLELLFRRERDTSPNDEIQRVRFERAATLLRSTTMSVTRIAELTGFSFRPPFCRFFQRMSGMTPLEYRAASRGTRGTPERGRTGPPGPAWRPGGGTKRPRP